MASLYRQNAPQSKYVDKRSRLTRQEWLEQLSISTTVYVGNLSFYTTEDQVYELFNTCGHIDVIVMGLNRVNKAPCGFCFVRYKNHSSAHRAVEILNGAQLDGRRIRVDWDSGKENRKYGRGVSGGQWRDEFRTDFDPGRGGEGKGMEYVQRKRYKRSRYENIAYWSKYINTNEQSDLNTEIKPHKKTRSEIDIKVLNENEL